MSVKTAQSITLAVLLSPVSGVAEVKTPGGSTPDYPQQMSAQQLLLACSASGLTPTGRERRRYCSGFVSGVEEAVRLQDQQRDVVGSICAPHGITARRLTDAFALYAARNTDALDKPAAAVVITALSLAFPCNESP